MSTKRKTAAANAAHDQQAGGAYRLAVCTRCGQPFAYPNARRGMCRTVCDDCKRRTHAANRRRDKEAHGQERDDYNRLRFENAEIHAKQRERDAARRAALRERDARHAAWERQNGVAVRTETRADGTVVETRGRVCISPVAPAEVFNPVRTR